MRQPYPTYRDSDVEWLGQVPEHWKVLPTKYAGHVIMGQSPPSDTYHDEPGERPFLQGNAEFGKDNPTPKWYCDTAPKIVETGNLLISVRAPVGALNKADQTYGIGRGLCGVAANHEHLDSAFAWWALHVTRRSLEPLSVGSTYDAVSAADVGCMSLPAPPLHEQQAIAAFLDGETAKIDTLISKNRLLLERLAEYRTALITRTVTKGLPPEAAKQAGLNPNPTLKPSAVEWLGDVPEHWEVKRLKYPTSSNDESLSETEDPLRAVVYVDIGAVDSSAGIVQTEEMVFEDAPSRARRLVRDGDTIISTVRTYLRAIAPIQNPPPEMVVSTGFAVIRPRTLDPGFATWVLREHGFVEEIVARSTGVSYPAINAPQIGNLPIPSPPPAEQQAIATFLNRRTERIDALCSRVETAIERLQEHRTALITAAVTGKIDVRDYVPVEMEGSAA